MKTYNTNQIPADFETINEDVNLLKVLALHQFNGDSFFFIDNEAFLGTLEDANESWEQAKRDNPTSEEEFRTETDTFLGFCRENLTVIEGNECTDESETDGKHIVLTDEEADEKAAEYIKYSLWAFNAGFIIQHSKLPYEAEEMIQAYQEKECESANDTIKALITNIDNFISDAISADGRGHFMSSYDGKENEVKVLDTTFFIYRIN